jgi:hypothetical protein
VSLHRSKWSTLPWEREREKTETESMGGGYYRVRGSRAWSKNQIEICHIKQGKREHSKQKEQHIAGKHVHWVSLKSFEDNLRTRMWVWRIGKSSQTPGHTILWIVIFIECLVYARHLARQWDIYWWSERYHPATGAGESNDTCLCKYKLGKEFHGGKRGVWPLRIFVL